MNKVKVEFDCLDFFGQDNRVVKIWYCGRPGLEMRMHARVTRAVLLN